jgi:hypothetical protein
MTSQTPDTEEVRKGTAFYSPWGLFIYNVYVLRFNNRCVWRCSRWKLLQHYDKNISSNHLDIGPGTGGIFSTLNFRLPIRKSPFSTLIRTASEWLVTGCVSTPLPR